MPSPVSEVPFLTLTELQHGWTNSTAAGCFVMTKIVMSDTNSLRENSTQNTFLALMYAVAYSIGPVPPPGREPANESVSAESLPKYPGDGVSESISPSA